METIHLMAQCVSRLRVESSVLYTAAVYMHRCADIPDIECVFTALASIVLATKIVEDPRTLRDVLNAYHDVLDATRCIAADELYWQQKDKMIAAEQNILRHLKFQVDVQLPYPYLLNIGRTLRCSKQVLQCAWTLLNDAVYSKRIIQIPPHVLAVGVLHASMQMVNDEEKSSRLSLSCTKTSVPWWIMMDTSQEDLLFVARLLKEVYINRQIVS